MLSIATGSTGVMSGTVASCFVTHTVNCWVSVRAPLDTKMHRTSVSGTSFKRPDISAVKSPLSATVPVPDACGVDIERSFGNTAEYVQAVFLTLNVKAVPGLSTSVAEICTGLYVFGDVGAFASIGSL